jgi:high-affinity nickel-transport protein
MNPEMTAMAGLVFALGARHGFDPDHLVAIDGLTRSSRSRWCGLFFSLGHGAAVTLIGVAVALAAAEWRAPPWLEQAGAAISVAVLVALGFANLLALVRAPAGSRVALVGVRGRWLAQRLAGAGHPAVITAVGAAFAVSLDTVSQTLVFSLGGAALAGVLFAAVLGVLFTLGMMLTDALNGLWVARMMSGTASASRWMSAAVALLCFGIALAAAFKHAVPPPALSAASLAAIAAVWLFTVLRSRSAYREARS